MVTRCLLVSIAGCKQTEGESCQLDKDCDSGLICCKRDPLAIESSWGVCMTPADCDTAWQDTSTDPEVDGEDDTRLDVADDEEPLEEVTDPVGDDPAIDPVEDTAVEDTSTGDVPEEDTSAGDAAGDDA
jgi:hypothetical protein